VGERGGEISGVFESVRVRARDNKRGVERERWETNGRCRRERGEIVGGWGRERGRRGVQRVCVRVREGERGRQRESVRV
jgi:hypothetical protein